ncbi:PHP domain-containing protein [Sphingobacterium multivorum]|uniref:PHP domain-containing protein n=1 Tax=Sphingobacterium multivorum TaxID=28454 RepID=UPI0021156942|nr:PHP domain-containing protein [Sphingobacterium multivorum]
MLLNLHSYYSLRFGTLSLQDLVSGMLAGGYDTAVLTDINNSSGSLDFIKLGRAAGLNLLAGMEFRNDDQLCFVAIAKMSVASVRSMSIELSSIWKTALYRSVRPNLRRSLSSIPLAGSMPFHCGTSNTSAFDPVSEPAPS